MIARIANKVGCLLFEWDRQSELDKTLGGDFSKIGFIEDRVFDAYCMGVYIIRGLITVKVRKGVEL